MAGRGVLVGLIFLAGCSAVGLRAGAERVRITNTEPGRECRFLGDVTGSQGNRLTGGVTSNANLETGARNDLKNKAFNMGGNVVHLLIQRDGTTGTSQTRKSVVLVGNVYRCPE